MIPDGSTPIKNEILIEIIAKGLLTWLEMRIACYIMRWSWGFNGKNRRQDWTNPLTKTEIAKDLGIHRQRCSPTINDMIDRKILKVKKPSTNRDTQKLCYQFNEHYENWKSVNKSRRRRETVNKSRRRLSTNRDGDVNKSRRCDAGDIDQQKHSETPKETIKETIKENISNIFTFWKETLNHPKAKFTPDRKVKIGARLKEGYTVKQCKEAILGCKASAYHMGANHNGRNGEPIIYDAIGLIFKNGGKLEQFIGYYEQAKKENQKEEIA